MTSQNRDRILVLVPGKNAKGGITTYYQTLGPLFSLPIDFIERGARNWPARGSFFEELIRIARDYYLFIIAIRKGKYSIVITNTSFSSWALIRDGIYLLIARMYRLKTITFFRGWDYKCSEETERKHLSVFKYIYFRSDALIDLAQKNVEILKKWGYTKKIYLETVAVDKDLLGETSPAHITEKYNSDEFNILFLARLEKAKGLYEAVDTYIILKKAYPNLRLTIAGDGVEVDNIRKYIQSAGINNITVTGYIEGKEKRNIFAASDVYLFPSYCEGMPSSLIEAMAFGLPVVTRSVGGVSDFFINAENGYITESKDPNVFAGLIEKLIKNRHLAIKMAINNFNYAQRRFLSHIVVARVEKILGNVLDS